MLAIQNQSTRKATRRNKGFSLVEVVVLFSILAILAIILSPSLLTYIEKTRAQKDDSAADEIVNAIILSMADDRVYNDVVAHVVDDNVSCYIDTAYEKDHNKIVNKLGDSTAYEQYSFGEEARQKDQTPFYLAGYMRGVTITFEPEPVVDSQKIFYSTSQAAINKFIKKDKALTLGDNCSYLYHRIRQTVGDQIDINSATYKNSEFTVFIKMGSTGGADSSSQEKWTVYGQFSGTNLSISDYLYYIAKDRVSSGSQDKEDGNSTEGSGGTGSVDPDLLDGDGVFITTTDGIPAGGYYYVGITGNQLGDYRTATATYGIGDDLPELSQGDVFVYGDYEYRYGYSYDGSRWVFGSGQNGWGVRVLSKSKVQYKQIITSINGASVNSLKHTFRYCTNLIVAPKIPRGVQNMNFAFDGCMQLTYAPAIPDGVVNLANAFSRCRSLKTAPSIPASVKNMSYAFYSCVKLNGTIKIDATPSNYNNCFLNVRGRVYLTGTSIVLKELAATDGYENLSASDCVRVLDNNPGDTTNIVPIGGTYYVGVGTTALGDYSTAERVITAGNKFPDTVKEGDVFVYGDYEYRYKYVFNWTKWVSNGNSDWAVRVRDNNKSQYGPILNSINSKPVTHLTNAFGECKNLVVSPSLPGTIKVLYATYYNCPKLETAPVIGRSVYNMERTFEGCSALSGIVEINCNASNVDRCFWKTKKPILVIGRSNKLNEIAATDKYSDNSELDNVRVLSSGQNTAVYVVNHWQQNMGGKADLHNDQNYTLVEVQKLNGIVGESITPRARTYKGFDTPASKTIIVSGNGAVVVNYYYTRQSFYIDLNRVLDGQPHYSNPSETPVKFRVTINGTVIAANAADYWARWPYGTTYEIEVIPQSGYSWDGTLRAGTSPLKGTVEGPVQIFPVITTNKETTYTVKCWMQNLDGNKDIHDAANYTLADTITLTALAGADVSPKPNTYTGFISPARQGVIVEKDGNTVINYYYERQSYLFNINARIDGKDCDNETYPCLLIITVNGKEDIVSSNYSAQLLYGSTYNIMILPQLGYTWDGSLANGSAPLEGTIDGRTNIIPNFTSSPK